MILSSDNFFEQFLTQVKKWLIGEQSKTIQKSLAKTNKKNSKRKKDKDEKKYYTIIPHANQCDSVSKYNTTRALNEYC